MPDHLQLAPPSQTDSKRRPPSPRPKETFDRKAHATTLAGVLAGLEYAGSPLFTSVIADDTDDEADQLGEVVLKFKTKGATSKGPFSKIAMTALGENADNEFYVLSPTESRRQFGELVRAYGGDPQEWSSTGAWLRLLDQIEDVSVYTRADRYDETLEDLDFADTDIIDVVLWPTSLLRETSAERVGRERLQELKGIVESFAANRTGIAILAEDPRPDTLFFRVVANEELMDELLEHPYVQKVRGRLAPRLAPAQLIPQASAGSPPPPAGASIGILDDLVLTANPWMRGVVSQSANFPETRVFGGATSHGTMVASIAAYGSLDAAARGHQPNVPFPILAARISEADRNGNTVVVGDVVSQFESAFAWLDEQGARIAVVAFAYDHADKEPLPTELTVTVDNLARKYQMVVVVSSGNIGQIPNRHWLNDYPSYLEDESSRVAAPGTAALALTVGAHAHLDVPSDNSLVAIAREGQPSPFSRTGPTRGNRFSKTRKPEFSGPGGNWGWRTNGSSPIPHDEGLGVVTLSTRNQPLFSVGSGTSLAAPFVAHEVAKIATRYPAAGPNLLRAITALSVPELPIHRSAAQASVTAAYGVPRADRVLESGGHRAIMVYEGQIDIGGRQIHELPVPDEFAELVPNSERRFRIVLAFDPPVKRSRRDYMAGRMHFDFVRNMTLAEVKRTWETQPTLAEREADPTVLYDSLPLGNQRPKTNPPVSPLRSNTLIRRDVATDQWNVDDKHYFLVVSHDSSAWTKAQLAANPVQNYALAIEMVDEGRPGLELHNLVQSRLQTRVQGRSRG